MIIDLFQSTEFIVNILKTFKDFALKNNLVLEILNTYNDPLMQDIKQSLEEEKKYKFKNLLVVNFTHFNHLKPRELRSGVHGYVDTNEYSLVFKLHFLSMESKDKTSFKNSLKMYELFNEFLYKTRFSFSEDREENLETKISIFISQINEQTLECPFKVNKVINTTDIGLFSFSTYAMFNAGFQVTSALKGG